MPPLYVSICSFWITSSNPFTLSIYSQRTSKVQDQPGTSGSSVSIDALFPPARSHHSLPIYSSIHPSVLAAFKQSLTSHMPGEMNELRDRLEKRKPWWVSWIRMAASSFLPPTHPLSLSLTLTRFLSFWSIVNTYRVYKAKKEELVFTCQCQCHNVRK